MKRVVLWVLVGGLVQPGVVAQQAAPVPAAASPSRTAPSSDAPLTLRATVMEAYDDNLLADTTVGVQSMNLGGFEGPYSAADAELTFRHKGARLSFDGEAGSAVRYYPVGLDLTTATHQASGRLQLAIARSSRLTLSQVGRYAPQQALSVLGTAAAIQPAASALDVALSSVGRLQTTTGLDFDVDLTRKTSATLTSGVAGQQLTGGEWIRRYDVGGRLAHDVSSQFRIAGDYRHQLNRGVGGTSSRVDDAAMTLSYDKPLSQTRRMRVEAGAGASMLDQQTRLQYRATAHARISRDIARTWSVGGAFARQYVYFDWLALPVFANRFSADISGHVGRRLQTKFEASFAGSEELPSSAHAFNAYLASGTITYALTQQLGFYAGYTRFSYEFLNGAALAPASRLAPGRNSIRTGVTVLMPMLGGRERKQP